MSSTRTQQNVWPFTEREVPASKPLKSGWSVGRASEEAYKAGYSGRVNFRDWLKSKKLDDRSQGQINLLARSYEDGMAKEDQDSRGKRGSGGYSSGGGHAGSGSGQVSSGALEKEVASALVNYGAGSGEAREAAREAVKGGGSFDAVFKRALDMVRHKQNPLGHGHWESFDSEKAAKQYARLMEGQGKTVTRHGKDVRVDEDNPARSGAQYRLAQAVLSGQSDAMPVSVARELVEKTPGELRSAWSKSNPEYSLWGLKRVTGYWERVQGPSDKETMERYIPYFENDEYAGGKKYTQLVVSIKKPKLPPLPSWLGGGKSNPEPAAADMYESFHGRPSEQIVTFEEDEHYHEYLSELGVCCGLLVEKEDGKCVALGLSGYVWQGKGKDAGFVEGGNTRSNPRNGYGRATWAMALDTTTATRDELKKAESVLFRAVMKVMPSSPLQRDLKEKYLKVREALGTSPNPKKGPILSSWDQANDLVYSGVKGLDQQLGKVLGNPVETATSFYIGPYSEHGPAHEKASRLQRDGYRGLQITGGGSQWYVLGVARSGQEIPNGAKLGSPSKRNPNSDSISPNTTLLSSNEDGTQLYLVGGDQSLDLYDLDITGHMATKELITIGDVVKLYYETEKDFDKFEVIQYHHEVGEESGVLPILAYDRLNKRMLFVGGDYHIEKPMFETSPGIEN